MKHQFPARNLLRNARSFSVSVKEPIHVEVNGEERLVIRLAGRSMPQLFNQDGRHRLPRIATALTEFGSQRKREILHVQIAHLQRSQLTLSVTRTSRDFINNATFGRSNREKLRELLLSQRRPAILGRSIERSDAFERILFDIATLLTPQQERFHRFDVRLDRLTRFRFCEVTGSRFDSRQRHLLHSLRIQLFRPKLLQMPSAHCGVHRAPRTATVTTLSAAPIQVLLHHFTEQVRHVTGFGYGQITHTNPTMAILKRLGNPLRFLRIGVVDKKLTLPGPIGEPSLILTRRQFPNSRHTTLLAKASLKLPKG